MATSFVLQILISYLLIQFVYCYPDCNPDILVESCPTAAELSCELGGDTLLYPCTYNNGANTCHKVHAGIEFIEIPSHYQTSRDSSMVINFAYYSKNSEEPLYITTTITHGYAILLPTSYKETFVLDYNDIRYANGEDCPSFAGILAENLNVIKKEIVIGTVALDFDKEWFDRAYMNRFNLKVEFTDSTGSPVATIDSALSPVFNVRADIATQVPVVGKAPFQLYPERMKLYRTTKPTPKPTSSPTFSPSLNPGSPTTSPMTSVAPTRSPTVIRTEEPSLEQKTGSIILPLVAGITGSGVLLCASAGFYFHKSHTVLTVNRFEDFASDHPDSINDRNDNKGLKGAQRKKSKGKTFLNVPEPKKKPFNNSIRSRVSSAFHIPRMSTFMPGNWMNMNKPTDSVMVEMKDRGIQDML